MAASGVKAAREASVRMVPKTERTASKAFAILLRYLAQVVNPTAAMEKTALTALSVARVQVEDDPAHVAAAAGPLAGEVPPRARAVTVVGHAAVSRLSERVD